MKPRLPIPAVAPLSTPHLPSLRNRLGWRRWTSLGDEWRLALILLVVQRGVLAIVGVTAIYAAGVVVTGGSWAELVIQGGLPWSALLAVWQRWDGLWYQHIVETGYRAGDGSTAFYPLYPLLVRIVSTPLLGHTVWAELLVSSAAFLCASGLLYRLAHFEAEEVWSAGPPHPRNDARANRARGRSPGASRGGSLATAVPGQRGLAPTWARRIAFGVVLGIALFPTGFFLLAPYTEGLFLALTVGALLSARRGRWWAAGAFAFAAALTRPQGVLLVLPMAYEYVRQRGAARWLLGTGGQSPDVRALAVTAPFLGLIAVTIYWRAALGEGGGVLDVQWLWGYQVVPPWEALAASWTFFTAGPPGTAPHLRVVEALNFACLAAFCALAVVMVRRLPIMYALYVWPSLGLLLFRQMAFSPLMSVSRYVLVLFPVFIMLAMLLAPRPRLAIGLLTLSALAQTALFWYWAQWAFIA